MNLINRCIGDYMPGFLGNIVSGYLGNKANQKISGINNPVARRLAGTLLGASPLGSYLPGLSNPPRNPDANLLFGARNLSELQLRDQIARQTDQRSQFNHHAPCHIGLRIMFLGVGFAFLALGRLDPCF